MSATGAERCRRYEAAGLLPETDAQLEPHLLECADCREDRRRLLAVQAELGTLPLVPAADHWEQAVWRRIAEDQRRRRRWWLVLPALAATALVALFLLRTDGAAPVASPPLLALRYEAGAERLRGGDLPAVGAQVAMRASGLAGAHRELRVYRDDVVGLLLRCSDQPPCAAQEDGALAASWRIPAVGRYRVLALASAAPLPPPSGTYELDLAALRRAQVPAIVEELIEVW